MGGFSFWHILLFALLVLLLFGGNRFSAMMGDIAKGLKSFKEGMNDEDERNRRTEDRRLPPGQQPIDTTATRDTRPYDPAPPPPPPPPGQSDTPQG